MGSIMKAIRGAIKARLMDSTSAGNRVSTNRADKIWKLGLPSIVIYTRSETVEQTQLSPVEYTRVASVQIDILMEEGAGVVLDDDADDLADEVEQLLFRDPRLVGELGRDFLNLGRQVGYDLIIAADGDKLISGARVTWEFTYFQAAPEGDPDEPDPFKIANAVISLDPSR